MKKVFYLLIILASVCGFVEYATTNAFAATATPKPVTVELTINSPGAGGSQFMLKGLQTPSVPSYTCTKTSAVSDAFGTATGIRFALIDINGINKVKITVTGVVVGRLSVSNATYVDQSGKSISGRISVRQL